MSHSTFTCVSCNYVRKRAANSAKNSKYPGALSWSTSSLTNLNTPKRFWYGNTTIVHRFSSRHFDSSQKINLALFYVHIITYNVIRHTCVLPVTMEVSLFAFGWGTNSSVSAFKWQDEFLLERPQNATFYHLFDFLSCSSVHGNRMENLSPKGCGIMPNLHFLFWSWWGHLS